MPKIHSGSASSTVSARILLVDDYEPWRRFVRSILEPQEQWQIVGEAADGLDAIQKARKLKPDVVLLDIGLPNLNGIEASRCMGELVPDAKIVFLSQNQDRRIVKMALSNGVQGYLLKVDATNELVPAIRAVLRGEKFASRRLRIKL